MNKKDKHKDTVENENHEILVETEQQLTEDTSNVEEQEPEIKVVDEKEFHKAKADFIAAINKLHTGGEKGVKVEKHPFFGKITTTDWGLVNYKHADHHLRQFGV